MPICPHCETPDDDAYVPCPSGDGFFTIPDADYHAYPDEPLLGRAVGGRFIVSHLLGQGSMARVFRARQANVDRDVAIKIFEGRNLAKEMQSENATEGVSMARKRFEQEAKVLAKLSHPNCVMLFDYGVSEDDKFLYIAMEHVQGFSLRTALKRGLKLPAILEITQQILLALREAHALGIVHRDLKPDNIILSMRLATDEQLVKVVDFGIAKMLGDDGDSRTVSGTLFGTPAYMSPEQCLGATDTVGPHSDIYSLGCMLFEMLSGRLPFEMSTPVEMIRAHLDLPVPEMVARNGVTIPEELRSFVTRCLQKDPADRFEDGQQALVEISKQLNPDRSGPLSTSELMRKRATASAPPMQSSVVVPGNQIRGESIAPPTVDAEEVPPVVTQQSASGFGPVVETQPEGSLEEGSDPPKSRSGIGRTTKIAIVGLVLVLGLCAAIFWFIYQSIMLG